MSDDAKQVLAGVDDLIARGRTRDRMAAARAAAAVAGGDPEVAATAASVEVRPPVLLAGKAPGTTRLETGEEWQHPVIRRRVERIRAAMNAGKITPAESAKVLEAMNADEAAATRLLDKMEAGGVPLEATAAVWGPDEFGPPLPPGEMLPEAWSLLSRSERAEIAARRAQ